jgi:hypothetical protein
MARLKILAVFILLLLFVTSCSNVLNSSKVYGLTYNYCDPSIKYDYSQITASSPKTGRQDSILQANLSKHDIAISEAIGIDTYLSEYFQANTDTLRNIFFKQKVTSRLMLTIIEIDALAAELDCNGEQIGQLANYVDNLNNRKIRGFTAASIAVGALTTVATVLVKDETANTWVGVGGGLLSTGLGAFSIFPGGKKVNLNFQRNLLKNIWHNDNTNQAYPNSIWNILNEKDFSNSGEKSLRENIVNRWIQYEFDGKSEPKNKEIFFEGGGIYTSEDLHSRANMLNELQATIRSIQQDMRSLAIKLNSL